MSEKETVLIRKCRCGSAHRIRYREPYLWIECKRKCGCISGVYRAKGIDDEKALTSAVEDWNRKVREQTS